MFKKLVWVLLFLSVLLVTFVLSAYMLSPHISRFLLVQWLEQQGFESVDFQMQPPTDNRLVINQLSLSHAEGQRHTLINIESLVLYYSLPELLTRYRLEKISTDQANVTILIDSSLPERIETLQKSTIDLHPQQLSELFAYIPAHQVNVKVFNLRYQTDDATEITLEGQLNLDDSGFQSSGTLFLDQEYLTHLSLSLARSGQLFFNLHEHDQPLIKMSGELSYLEDHWRLSSGHQVFTQSFTDWLNRQFSLSISSELGLQDPLSFTSRLTLPGELPLDPGLLLDSLNGDLTLGTRMQPAPMDSFAYHMDLRVIAQLSLYQRNISGQVQAAATERDGLIPGFQLNGQLSLPKDFDQITFEGTVDVDALEQGIKLSATHTTQDTTQLNWTLPTQSAPPIVNLIRQYVTQIPSTIMLESGQFSASGTVNMGANQWRANSRSKLYDATLVQGNIRIEGVDWQNQATLNETGNWQSHGDVSVEQVNVGLPINLTPIDYQLQHQSNQLNLNTSSFTASLLGGTVYVPRLNFNPVEPDLLFLVSLRNFDLGAILALYADRGLYGEGQIDGQLPIQFNAEGLRIDSGNVGTVMPGVIRFQPDDDLKNMAESNLGLRIALEALTDLRYDLLDLDVQYHPNGDLILVSRMQGNNPDWQQGRPIDLTVTIEDNIPKLLRALQITGRITDALDRHFQQSP